MDPISRTTRTAFPTTRSKNNQPLQHPCSFRTAITSANPNVRTKFRQKKKELYWLQSETIVEVLPFQQYKIWLDGSEKIFQRNQQQIKPNNSEIKPFIILSATPPSQTIPNKPTSPNHDETTVAHPPTTPDSPSSHALFYKT